jgi:energy-coupling factor transport system permease protein
MYRRLAGPLHAARAGAGGAYCAALAAAALILHHPLALAAAGIAIVGAAVGAGVGRAVRRVVIFGSVFALLIVVINVLVSRNGLTVFARLGEVPPFGQLDLTVEALVEGALAGAKVCLVVGAFAVLGAAVDPDEVLRLFRRASFHSALSATLATRLIPVLARDARRLDDARRCRPDGGGRGPAARTAVARAVAANALDRAVDVAATLEVRGYATALRPGVGRVPWSRHDITFAAAAVVILALAIGARVAGLATVQISSTVHVGFGSGEWAIAAALVVVALLPFADRRGVER